MTVIDETTERLEGRLPAFLPDETLSNFLQAAAVLYQRPEEALRHDDRGSGWRRLLDPDRTPAWALPWLAQLVGSPDLKGLTEAQQRVAVRDSPTLRRGTLGAIVTAARQHLTPGGEVNVIERDGGAYRITVQTHPSQTPDPDLVEAAIRAAKPAGLVLTYVLFEGLLVSLFEGIAWPTVGAFESTFDDVAEFEDYNP